MAQTNTITPARKAMLELIKNNRNNRNISCIINSNNSGGDNDRLKKKKPMFDIPNQHEFNKELDQKRRSAYIVRLGGK